MKASDEIDLAEDLLEGVPAIAAYTGHPVRRTYYLLERGLLPAFKNGEIWTSLKSSLRRHYDQKVSQREAQTADASGAA